MMRIWTPIKVRGTLLQLRLQAFFRGVRPKSGVPLTLTSQTLLRHEIMFYEFVAQSIKLLSPQNMLSSESSGSLLSKNSIACKNREHQV